MGGGGAGYPSLDVSMAKQPPSPSLTILPNVVQSWAHPWRQLILKHQQCSCVPHHTTVRGYMFWSAVATKAAALCVGSQGPGRHPK